MDLTYIINLNKEKIEFLLTNHKFFTKLQIQLAAKRLVYLNKNPQLNEPYQKNYFVNNGLNDLAQRQQAAFDGERGFGGSSLFGGAFH